MVPEASWASENLMPRALDATRRFGAGNDLGWPRARGLLGEGGELKGVLGLREWERQRRNKTKRGGGQRKNGTHELNWELYGVTQAFLVPLLAVAGDDTNCCCWVTERQVGKSAYCTTVVGNWKSISESIVWERHGEQGKKPEVSLTRSPNGLEGNADGSRVIEWDPLVCLDYTVRIPLASVSGEHCCLSHRLQICQPGFCVHRE